MAPTIPLAPQSAYTPTSDAMARHEYGVTKTRKTASTGGGRAWSEEEVRFDGFPMCARFGLAVSGD